MFSCCSVSIISTAAGYGERHVWAYPYARHGRAAILDPTYVPRYHWRGVCGSTPGRSLISYLTEVVSSV